MIIQLGLLIRERREELGLTQEDLADGICSVPTLSRIENGERMPTKDNCEMLLQRLGYSESMMGLLVDESEFDKHELKYRLRHALISDRMSEAEHLFEEMESKLTSPTRVDQQFLSLWRILTHQDEYSIPDRRSLLESALRLTCPKYDGKILPNILSYEEILILNNIALCYGKEKDYGRSIEIFFAIKKFYDNYVINPEEALRTKPMILYNLSKSLGLAGRYNECIEICDLGIRLAQETGRSSFLPSLYFNRSWALIHRKLPGDIEAARNSVKLACYSALVLGKKTSLETYMNFMQDTFKEKMLL